MRLAPALLAALIWPVAVAAAASEAPVLRVALDAAAAVPGQPIVLRVTVLTPTWMPEAPVFPSFEIPNVMVRLPARAAGPVSERIGGDAWAGVTRAYRLHPMTVGRFRIPPRPLSVTYADPETHRPVTVDLETPAITFAGEAPDAARDLDPFIAAGALTLEQTISGDPGDLEPGDVVVRTVTARIAGTAAMVLPPLIPAPAASGPAAYPKEPAIAETESRGVLSGTRVESVSYVAGAGGRYAAPAIRLRWLDLATGRIETAEVDGFALVVRAPLPVPSSAPDWRAAALYGLPALVLLGAAAPVARRLRPGFSAWRRRRREARRASEAFAYAAVRATLRARDHPGALRALALWDARLAPADAAEEGRLRAAFLRLSEARYGPAPAVAASADRSEALTSLAAARRARRRAAATARTARALPDLNPGRPA